MHGGTCRICESCNEVIASSYSFLGCLLLLLSHGSPSTPASTQFRSSLYLLTGLEIRRFRLTCRTVALSRLHGINEIALELLGYAIVCVEIVFLKVWLGLVIYFNWTLLVYM